MIRGNLIRPEHLSLVSKAEVHVERVSESVTEVVYWMIMASRRVHRQVILLIIKVHGDRRTVDVFRSPSIDVKEVR